MNISSLKKRYPSFLKDDLPFWVVDSFLQKIILIEDFNKKIEFPVSTSENGLGNEEGSFKTPTGLHRIHDMVGKDEPEGMIFVERKETGEIWDGKPGENSGLGSEDDLILTRVITLEGCEDTINKGSCVDTLKRHIYIHGTNAEDLIGTPVSHGCIRMENRDIIKFFNLCTIGMFVVIE